MYKRLVRFLKSFLVFLVPALFVACVGANGQIAVLQTPGSFGKNGKSLVQARVGKTHISPFPKDIMKSFEDAFTKNFHTFQKTPGLFQNSSKDIINFRVDLISLKNIENNPSSGLWEVVIRYEFRMDDGAILMVEEITSTGTDDTSGLYTRAVIGVNLSFSNNIALLAKTVKEKLPGAWETYAKERKAEEQQITANLKKTDSYFRVFFSKAVIRQKPDADAREVANLSHEELVNITGTLPSGWFQVSRGGKPVGWIHKSVLEEDPVSVPSHRTEGLPPIVTPTEPSSTPGEVTASLDFGSYYALVVGNNNYQSLSKINTAVNDAKVMAGLLQEKYGFKVQLLKDATRSEILQALNDYSRTLTKSDNLLFYYAGHGWLDRSADEGYWLPVDAESMDPTNWISNRFITNTLRTMRANHVLVVADSCYSGKLPRGVNLRVRSRDYYAQISKKKARTVLASGSLEPVADNGGKGKHSVFTSALIEALSENKGILDTTTLFNKIRRPIIVNSDQTPEYSDIRKAGHDGGDFLFVPHKQRF